MRNARNKAKTQKQKTQYQSVNDHGEKGKIDEESGLFLDKRNTKTDMHARNL